MCIFYAFFYKIFSKVSKSINSKATQAESDSQMTIPTPHKTTSEDVGRCGRGWELFHRVALYWPGLGIRSLPPVLGDDSSLGAGADWNLSARSEICWCLKLHSSCIQIKCTDNELNQFCTIHFVFNRRFIVRHIFSGNTNHYYISINFIKLFLMEIKQGIKKSWVA